MSFLKNLFGKKESDSDKPKQDSLPEYFNSAQKVMTELDIITEAFMAAEEIYTKRDYEVYHVQDFATELSDFIKHATENSSDCLVALVNIDNPKQRSAMYFGEPYSYTIKEQFYPSLS